MLTPMSIWRRLRRRWLRRRLHVALTRGTRWPGGIRALAVNRRDARAERHRARMRERAGLPHCEAPEPPKPTVIGRG